VAGSPDDLRGDSGRRLQTFRDACAQFDLALDERLIVYGRHVYDGGFAAAQQIFASRVDFDALIASNDESAIGAMDALKQAGLRIPEDVAVIGFDNRLEGAVQQPALISVHVPLFNMGYQAMEQMWQHLSLGVPLPDSIEADAHLVIRQSCGCGKTTAGQVSLNAAQPLFRQIAEQIQKQVFDLSEEETLALCRNLSEAFETSLESGDPLAFRTALKEVLQRTVKSQDGAHIWQDAITLLGQSLKERSDPSLG